MNQQQIENEILRFLKDNGRSVMPVILDYLSQFTNVDGIEIFGGNIKNLIIWPNLDYDVANAFGMLWHRKQIKLVPAQLIDFLMAGQAIDLPAAEKLPRNMKYHKPHWLPVALEIN